MEEMEERVRGAGDAPLYKSPEIRIQPRLVDL